MAWFQSIGEHLWVGGGALLTVALGVALLYWTDQEWRSRDREQRRRRNSAVPPADAQARPPSDADRRV